MKVAFSAYHCQAQVCNRQCRTYDERSTYNGVFGLSLSASSFKPGFYPLSVVMCQLPNVVVGCWCFTKWEKSLLLPSTPISKNLKIYKVGWYGETIGFYYKKIFENNNIALVTDFFRIFAAAIFSSATQFEVSEGLRGEFSCQARNLAGLGPKCSVKVCIVLFTVLLRNTRYRVFSRCSRDFTRWGISFRFGHYLQEHVVFS